MHSIFLTSPKTLLGKLIGGFCALSGVFILTLPIPIVVNSFAVFYKNRLWRNEVEHKKKARTLLHCFVYYLPFSNTVQNKTVAAPFI